MIMWRRLLDGAGGHQAPLSFSAAAVGAVLRLLADWQGASALLLEGGRVVFVDCSREAAGVGLTSRQLLGRGAGIMEGRSFSWSFLAG